MLFNMLSRLVIAFLSRSKHLFISWLQSPSAVILKPKKIKSAIVSTVSPSICHEVMGPDAMIFVFLMLSFKIPKKVAISLQANFKTCQGFGGWIFPIQLPCPRKQMKKVDEFWRPVSWQQTEVKSSRADWTEADLENGYGYRCEALRVRPQEEWTNLCADSWQLPRDAPLDHICWISCWG